MKLTSLTILLLTSIIAHSQSLPDWFTAIYTKKGLDKEYVLISSIKPSFLSADFNADTYEDIAVLVVAKKTKKKGVLIIHQKTNTFAILGAGNRLSDGGDDFSWIDKWQLYKKRVVFESLFDKKSGDIIESRKVDLKQTGILLEDYEDGAVLSGGILYWNGKTYQWIQQGE